MSFLSKKQHGFTVIELTVVIVIIGILVSIGAAQLIRSQTVARDKARVNSVSAISLALEDVAQRGQLDGVIIPSGGSVTSAVPLGYPSTALITAPTDPQTTSILGNIDQRSLKSPKALSSATTPNFSLVAATDNSSTPWTAPTTPSASYDVYVYQPLDKNGGICKFATGNPLTGPTSTQQVIAPQLINNCVRFNIYYYSEGQNTILSQSSTKRSNNGL